MHKSLVFTFVLFSCLLLKMPALACGCGDKISSLKANMHTFQTILETYAVDHGEYPKNIQELKQAAFEGDYWKEFKNPFTSQNGYNKSYGDLSHIKINQSTQRLESPEYDYLFGLRVVRTEITIEYPKKGIVLYEFISSKTYRIYGTKADGLLITDRNNIFFLSNE